MEGIEIAMKNDAFTSQPKASAYGEALSKVPEVTLGFWILKIAATTLGETGGDAVSMSWLGETTPEATGWGYLIGTGIFGVIFVAAVIAQIKASKFHPLLYWLTIVATTTVGTTLADYCDRSLGIGYTGGSLILFTGVVLSLFAWYRTMGTISVDTVSEPKTEAFYWTTIMFSQTLGTALGDWVADAGFGFGGGALFFLALLAVVAALYFWTSISRTALFWAAFILTRPLGATVGDFFDKPHAKGGLEMSRYTASAVLVAFLVIGMYLLPHRAAKKAH
jgi:uncharacterized membrane-anchored protein